MYVATLCKSYAQTVSASEGNAGTLDLRKSTFSSI